MGRLAGAPVLKLRPAIWIVLLGTILLFMFIFAGVVYNDELEAWYWRTTFGPALERDLGFSSSMERRTGFTGSALVIGSVQSGGVFDRAGIRAGDRPWDQHGRAEITFFRRLESARGQTTSVAVVRPGGSAGEKGDMALIMRFDVSVPAK